MLPGKAHGNEKQLIRFSFFLMSGPSYKSPVTTISFRTLKKIHKCTDENGEKQLEPSKGERILISIKKLSILYLLIRLFKNTFFILVVIQGTVTYLYVLNEKFLLSVRRFLWEEVFDEIHFYVVSFRRIVLELLERSITFHEGADEIQFLTQCLVYQLKVCWARFPKYSGHSPFNRARFAGFIRDFWRVFKSDAGLGLVISPDPLKTVLMSLLLIWIFRNLDALYKPIIVVQKVFVDRSSGMEIARPMIKIIKWS
jgi:hypothetical protein